MNSSHFLLSLIACFLFIENTAFGEVVQYEMCSDEVNSCNVHEVRITPCKEAQQNKPCKIKRGKSGSIAVDFTPTFSADTMTGALYWKSQIDLPFAGMDTNACNYMTCPMTQDVKTTYDFALNVSKKLPVSTYDIKLKLQNGDKLCCVIMSIALVK